MKYILRAINKPTLWLIAVFFLVGILPQFTSVFESSKQYPVQPIATVLNLINDSDETEVTRLKKENLRLKNEITSLNNVISSYAEKLSHCKNFQQAVGSEKKHKLISAEILIGIDLSEWRFSLAINKGSQADVKVGYPVVAGNVLIGRVVAVGLWVSRVQLIVDPAFPGVKSIVMKKSNKKNMNNNLLLSSLPHGIILGSAKRDYELSLKHIPLVAEVNVGDELFVSNQSAIFPGGLYVGTVKQVLREGDPKFFRIDIEPAVDPRKLEQVEVVVFDNKLLQMPAKIPSVSKK